MGLLRPLFASLTPSLVPALTAQGPLAIAAGCFGTQYSIEYTIVCVSRACKGVATHPDGRITSAYITVEEAQQACAELMN